MKTGILKARIYCIETGEYLNSVNLSGIPNQGDVLSLTSDVTDTPAQHEVRWIDHVIADASDGNGHNLVVHVEKLDDL